MNYTQEQLAVFALIQNKIDKSNWFEDCSKGKIIVSWEDREVVSIVALKEDKYKERY